MNQQHMDRPEEDLEMLVLDTFCWKNVRLGLKPGIKFGSKMSTKCLFNQRSFYTKLN